MKILDKTRDWFHGCMRSRLAWALASLHAVWFFAALHAMGPASRAAAQFWDTVEGADWTIFAGRTFHFTYEPMVVKLLWAADLPALLLTILPDLLAAPLIRLAHLGTFESSYVAAGEFLIAGSLQWLAIGRWLEVRWYQRKVFRMQE
jgi:hypothetical protein